ncbi:MAG: hypothetical protein ABW185_17795 [Sedimenticola sp.]
MAVYNICEWRLPRVNNVIALTYGDSQLGHCREFPEVDFRQITIGCP